MEISSNNQYNYGVAGFGEHTNASNGPDKLDMATPMLFENNINITMEGLTLDGSSLARDIRDLGQNNVWIATVTSHLKSGEIMDLSFNGYADLESDESLVLFDLQNGKMMEINRNTTYSFAYQPNYKLKIIKGIDSFIDEHAQVDHMIAGDLFPNPSNGIFSFDILLPKVEDVSINVTVSDLTGRIVAEKQHQSMESGLNSLEIDLRELNLSSGLYLFDIQMVDKYSHNVGNKITKKGYLISK